ncbi:hypothetical protein ACFWUP_23550 [Nocardia sp. NPDC058658]|uniref:hypothetical protein n=1 Tax=Nocardia sp. NPDC058658 TaxID=3346580 RepID=UPI003653110A
MSSGSWVSVAAPITVAGAVSTGLAVAVNLATGGGPWWLWAIVAALTVAGVATSVWLYHQQSPGPSTPPSGTAPSTSGAHAEGGSIAINGPMRGDITLGAQHHHGPTAP